MRNVFFAVVIILVLAGLFFVVKPKPQSQTVSPKQTQTISPSVGPAKTKGKVFEFSVKNNKLVSGPETISVIQGDTVTIKITADENEELHLHGYDNSVDLEKNKPAELTFTADKTGRFDYELENSKTDIGVLEVQPK